MMGGAMVDIPANELFALLRPFLQRMQREDAFDALQDIVMAGLVTVAQVNDLFPFWSMNHAIRATEEARQAAEEGANARQD